MLKSRKDTSQKTADSQDDAQATALKNKGWLTEYRLRQSAELAGYPTTHAQLMRLHEWDLLGQRQCGLWPPEAADRVIQARKLESDKDGARFLPRRVIRLRADFQRFPIPNETLRRAMVELVSGIQRPAHSLQLVHQAMCWLVELRYAQYGPPRPLGQVGGGWLLNEERYPPPFPPSAQLPAPTEWKAILKDPTVPNDMTNGLSFGRVAWDSYRWNLALEGEMKRQETAYLQIPLEERIVVLTVRHLSLVKQSQDDAAKSREERVNQLRERLASL